MVTNPKDFAPTPEDFAPTPEKIATSPFPDFPDPDEEIIDPKRLFAEYAILGGMLQARESFIQSGASTDWSTPLNEAIARACVEAWEQHGAETDEAWRCHCSAFMARYTGRSPLIDPAMRAWVFYMVGFHEMQFASQVSPTRQAELDELHQWLQVEKAAAMAKRQSATGAALQT